MTPFHFWPIHGKPLGMRDKGGNGHNVDLDQLLEDIKVVVRDGQELLKTGASTLKQQAIAGAERTGELARARPYGALGLVFGLGLLVGLLASTMAGRGSEED